MTGGIPNYDGDGAVSPPPHMFLRAGSAVAGLRAPRTATPEFREWRLTWGGGRLWKSCGSIATCYLAFLLASPTSAGVLDCWGWRRFAVESAPVTTVFPPVHLRLLLPCEPVFPLWCSPLLAHFLAENPLVSGLPLQSPQHASRSLLALSVVVLGCCRAGCEAALRLLPIGGCWMVVPVL